MTNNPKYNQLEIDMRIAAVAEAHRIAESHTVWVLPGAGWICEECNDDWEEVIEEYRASR